MKTKRFTMIELIAVLSISVFLVSILFSISTPNSGNNVHSQIGSLITKGNTHCLLTGETIVCNIVTSGSDRYFETVIDGKSERIDFEDLRVETNVNTFSMSLKGCQPQGEAINIIIDGGLHIRVNTFTNKVFYYAIPKPKKKL